MLQMNNEEELKQAKKLFDKHKIGQAYRLDPMAEDFSLMSTVYRYDNKEKNVSRIEDYDNTILTAQLNKGKMVVDRSFIDILRYVISPKDTQLEVINNTMVHLRIFIKKNQKFLLNIPLWSSQFSYIELEVDSDIKQLQYTGLKFSKPCEIVSRGYWCIGKYFYCRYNMLTFNNICRNISHFELVAAIYNKYNRAVDKNTPLYRAMKSGMFEPLLFTDKRYITAYIGRW